MSVYPFEDCRIDELCYLMAQQNFAHLPSVKVRELLLQRNPQALSDFSDFQDSWSRLTHDGYMADGGTYRKRRYATLSVAPSELNLKMEPHQPHYQSTSYNHLNGGIERWFDPAEESVMQGQTMSSLLKFGCEIFSRLSPYSAWHVEVHQFRIEAGSDTKGLPTPEGTHRDGVSFVMMMLVHRENAQGGQTIISDPEGNSIRESTLEEPLEMLLVNDERVRHAVTPVGPLDKTRPATRDVLVATYRYKLAAEM